MKDKLEKIHVRLIDDLIKKAAFPDRVYSFLKRKFLDLNWKHNLYLCLLICNVEVERKRHTRINYKIQSAETWNKKLA